MPNLAPIVRALRDDPETAGIVDDLEKKIAELTGGTPEARALTSEIHAHVKDLLPLLRSKPEAITNLLMELPKVLLG